MGSLTSSLAGRERSIGVLAVVLLLLAMLLVAVRTLDDNTLVVEAPDELTIEPVESETSPPPEPSPTPSLAPVGTGGLVLNDASEADNSPPPTRTVAAGSTSWFAGRFPAHAAANESARDPSTSRWALLIGVNEHTGRTRDNVGSRQDAEDLADHLSSNGWRDDHVLLLTDATATRRHILEGLAWLARKTSDDSIVVIHYSGHVKQWYGWDVDGDGESTDEALWPSDNQFIVDSDFSERVARVRASRLWVDIGGCEAAGFADSPMIRSRAVYTFSSEEDEKSYEDPSAANSIWGWYLVDRGLLQGHADRDNNGRVSVEEAFDYAGPRATARTSSQERGPQTPVIIDNLPGDFIFEIPPPPPPPQPDPPGDHPTDGGIIAPPPDDDEDDGGCFLVVFC
ncbi:MAG TPA: caspase family protein [Nitriliruptorales bacterium]